MEAFSAFSSIEKVTLTEYGRVFKKFKVTLHLSNGSSITLKHRKWRCFTYYHYHGYSPKEGKLAVAPSALPSLQEVMGVRMHNFLIVPWTLEEVRQRFNNKLTDRMVVFDPNLERVSLGPNRKKFFQMVDFDHHYDKIAIKKSLFSNEYYARKVK